jgi:hypothetical protein
VSDDVVYVLLPLTKAVPPEEAAYQSITAPLDEALRTTVPVPQREADVTVGLAGTAFTVAVTATRAEVQPVALLRAWA